MESWLQDVSLLSVLHAVIIAVVVPVVVLTKKDSTAAIAWCLAVVFLPFLGALLFWEFGYNYLYRISRRRREHLDSFQRAHPPTASEATRGDGRHAESIDNELARMAMRANAFAPARGNRADVFADTRAAFASMLAAIGAARHHVHAEFFIIRGDETGGRFLAALAERARAGVEVRLLFDGWGSFRLGKAPLAPLRESGGQVEAFLPLSPLRSMLHFNLRNHRKIIVVDGHVGFTGGMNIGDEYLGQNKYFGHWRDSVIRVAGPAVAALQRVFTEDWSFARREELNGKAYFPDIAPAGDDVCQVAASGPDQDLNCIREIYLMAIHSARQRLWIASPYFIPDATLLDALRMATLRGVDVRLLTIQRPDHYLSYYAGRYFINELLGMGVQVYQYQPGMMHSKLIMVDGRWAMVGSANFDYRSLQLNFEAGVALHTPAAVAQVEAEYASDLDNSIKLDPRTFVARSLIVRVLENGCRLLAPSL